ncbi:MAG: CPBP family intramembrane glutamic endopeptidase [Candidatus Saccharimonadales bacterium]
MSANSSNHPTEPASLTSHEPPSRVLRRHEHWQLLGLPAWVLFGFVAAQMLLLGIIVGLQAVGLPLKSINPTIFNTIIAAAVYVLSLGIVIGVPWLVKKRRTSRAELGLHRLPSWTDILLAPAGFVVYLIASGVLVYLATQYLPGFNATQAQEVGFDHLTQRYELVLAFITLVIIAPVAEETLFRGYLYGKLRTIAPVWVAVLITSVLFAALHLPGNNALQWNVAVDVFALSLVLCSLREVSGSIWAGVLLHMMKNGLAFYLLFINPTLLHTIGG